jgi:hypothetical protein
VAGSVDDVGERAVLVLIDPVGELLAAERGVLLPLLFLLLAPLLGRDLERLGGGLGGLGRVPPCRCGRGAGLGRRGVGLICVVAGLGCGGGGLGGRIGRGSGRMVGRFLRVLSGPPRLVGVIRGLVGRLARLPGIARGLGGGVAGDGRDPLRLRRVWRAVAVNRRASAIWPRTVATWIAASASRRSAFR